jgi:hypothetical protein
MAHLYTNEEAEKMSTSKARSSGGHQRAQRHQRVTGTTTPVAPRPNFDADKQARIDHAYRLRDSSDPFVVRADTAALEAMNIDIVRGDEIRARRTNAAAATARAAQFRFDHGNH